MPMETNVLPDLSPLVAKTSGNASPTFSLPKDNSWWDGMDSQDLSNIHAATATCAAFHADVAAKHAASLAQWVQYLWGQIATLQGKVVELEEWKKKTLDDMTRLRFEHKLLRRKVLPDGPVIEDETQPLQPKAKSLVLADHVDSEVPVRSQSYTNRKKALTVPAGAMRPPPGLEEVQDALCSAKQVRFAAESHVPHSPATSRSLESGRSASDLSLTKSTSFVSYVSSDSLAFTDDGPLEGINVTSGVADGMSCEIAEWRIGNLSTKLKGCMGRALVSPPFSAWGLEDLRLMVFPDGKEPLKGPRNRKQKEGYTKKVTEGPLDGCLKLKVPECPAPHIIEYFLHVGSMKCGPFKHNFGESTVNGCSDFGVDWLQEVEQDLSLTVKVEILKFAGAVDSLASGSPS